MIQEKAIIHYQVYIKISAFLKFLGYNKKLKPTKQLWDQEIYVTIFVSVSV